MSIADARRPRFRTPEGRHVEIARPDLSLPGGARGAEAQGPSVSRPGEKGTEGVTGLSGWSGLSRRNCIASRLRLCRSLAAIQYTASWRVSTLSHSGMMLETQ